MQRPIIDDDMNRKRICTPDEARVLLNALRALHQELSPLARQHVRIALAELANEPAELRILESR